MAQPVKLLIVDDEPVILKSLSALFESTGYTIYCASSAQEAIQLMEQELCHIVVSDIKMPNMTGNELLRYLKDINPMCQVIMMTGYSTMEYVVECLGIGACDYFLKPFSDISLLQRAVIEAGERVQRWYQVMQDTFKVGVSNG